MAYKTSSQLVLHVNRTIDRASNFVLWRISTYIRQTYEWSAVNLQIFHEVVENMNGMFQLNMIQLNFVIFNFLTIQFYVQRLSRKLMKID